MGEAARKALARATRATNRYGWIGFWVQLSLSLVSSVILLFSVAFTSQVGGWYTTAGLVPLSRLLVLLRSSLSILLSLCGFAIMALLVALSCRRCVFILCGWLLLLFLTGVVAFVSDWCGCRWACCACYGSVILLSSFARTPHARSNN